ncbi:hypothetical protein J2Z76_002341 [Sedimentibacter acidaminivorans]|jgi:hypothetical protein|uniref:DUF5666 domain-containing protein n=1 Tax=Sedimentibacter acidaminivorans TaxID=913099 RepID=A0ABS4GG01_9FIRM|nr:hypothetical protein [Sedimentibacter acidaminivorans]MBP1926472.1 hypothetical protein [Sedimentibacter acidaminivorans]
MYNYFINGDVDAMRKRNEVIFVQDALIEEIIIDNRTGFVTISYGVMGERCMVYMQLVTLVVDRDTVIRNQFGQDLSLRDLREGMIVDAEFSSAMTRSIPPQSRAFRITVIQNDSINITEDRVLSVDINNGFFYTGNAEDMLSQMRFVVNNETRIMDRRGNKIRLRDLRPGQLVRVEHANFQTMSIPPQTTAFNVQIL